MEASTRKIKTGLRHRKAIRLVPMTILLALTVTFLIPQPAYAAEWWDVVGNIEESFCGWLLEAACSFFNLYSSLIDKVTDNTTLTASFSSLLGTDMYTLTSSIHQTVIVPIAESILALFMLVQLVKISQRIDATATLPAVKDIVFLAVTYVLLHWFISHSLEIMQAIYQIAVDTIIPGIGTMGDKVSFGTVTTDGIELGDVNIGDCFMALIAGLLSLLTGIVAYIVSFIVAYARAWQIYVLAAFSSIPIALLGFDETRQAGIGFIKNFAAAVLAGAIMVFLLVAYPYILSALVSGTPGTSGNLLSFIVGGEVMDGMTAILAWLGSSILLVFGLVKSGAWAKEILGN